MPTPTTVAEAMVTAFHASRGIGLRADRLPTFSRQYATSSAAELSIGDATGSDVESAREMAYATLTHQDFRPEAVSLFLDDITHAAAQIAANQRARA